VQLVGAEICVCLDLSLDVEVLIVSFICVDCHNVFALMCRSNQDLKEKLYLFTLANEETDKLLFLRTLCCQMANTVCKADAVSTDSYCRSTVMVHYYVCYSLPLNLLSVEILSLIDCFVQTGWFRITKFCIQETTSF
jgi:hypothetical protein